jgi:hypothetical protein
MKYYRTEAEADRTVRNLQKTYPEFKFRYQLSKLGHAWFIEFREKRSEVWVYTWPELMASQYS